MPEKPQYQELANRIKVHLASCTDERSLREIGIAWDGYITALLEWGILSVDDHEALFALLPTIKNSPVQTILMGVDGQYN